LFKFTGNESEINLLGDGSENPEFSEWKWVAVEEVIKNVWLLTTNLHTGASMLQLTAFYLVDFDCSLQCSSSILLRLLMILRLLGNTSIQYAFGVLMCEEVCTACGIQETSLRTGLQTSGQADEVMQHFAIKLPLKPGDRACGRNFLSLGTLLMIT